MPDLSKVLGQLRERRASLQAELDAAGGGKQDLDKLAKKAMAELSRLRTHFQTADPMKVRAVAKAVLSKITLWWEPQGKQHRVARGLIEFTSKGVETPHIACGTSG